MTSKRMFISQLHKNYKIEIFNTFDNGNNKRISHELKKKLHKCFKIYKTIVRKKLVKTNTFKESLSQIKNFLSQPT